MGSLCSGALAAAEAATGMKPPELPMDDLKDKLVDLMSSFPDEAAKKEEELKAAYDQAKTDGKDYDVPGAKDGVVIMTLKQDLEDEKKDKEIKKASVIVTGKGTFADNCADTCWGVVEPKLDEKKPAELPDEMWKKMKDMAKDKMNEIVSQKIQEKIDELIKKIEGA